jgi:hypothetical protein
MKLRFNRYGLRAAALCVLALAACNAVEDVRQQPTTPAPNQTAVLQGKITGLGARRPVVLRFKTGSSDYSFFGVLNQDVSAFSFGSLPVGTAYDIQVVRQPFARNCTVTNGTGTVTAAPSNITVTCAKESTVRYCVGGTLTQAVHDTPGARIILNTEEGTREVAAATLAVGTANCWFPNSIFDSLTSAPVFLYTVTASFADANGTVNNCAVTNGVNATSGTGSEAGPVSPTGNVLNVQVTACSFPVTVNVAYNGTPTQATLIAPVTLELRDPRTGLRVVQKDPVSGNNVQLAPITVAAFGTVTFPGLLSNLGAMYDLVVTGQPTVAGQQVWTCVVGNTTPTAQLTAGSAVLLINPADTTNGFVPAASATNPAAGISKSVRCRANPAVANRLRGIYQQTLITTATTGTTTVQNRNFISFFEDGTFLYGIHSPGVTTTTISGVENGFYAYDPVAKTIAFTPLTDSITSTTANANRVSLGGAAGTITNVVKTTTSSSSQITARKDASNTWQLDQPLSYAGQLTGAWASADHRQIFVYEANAYTGMYVGVNGLATAADSCWPIDPPTALSGYFSRRGNATTCQLALGTNTDQPAALFTLTVPFGNGTGNTTTPALPEGYVGRWPQSASTADGRPSSPASFLIEPGTPDKLTVQDTLNGAPVNAPFIFYRATPN